MTRKLYVKGIRQLSNKRGLYPPTFSEWKAYGEARGWLEPAVLYRDDKDRAKKIREEHDAD